MNIKNLRKNYALLSMHERLALYEKALFRFDSSEADAIVAASPKTTWQVTDFYFLQEKVFQLQIHNLFERMKFYGSFELFLEFSLETENIDKFERLTNNVMLSAYLYKVETDAWQIAGKEFGIDVEGFRELVAKDIFAFKKMELQDAYIKSMAFTDEGVKNIIASENRRKVVKSNEIKTLESQIEFYKELLSSY